MEVSIAHVILYTHVLPISFRIPVMKIIILIHWLDWLTNILSEVLLHVKLALVFANCGWLQT